MFASRSLLRSLYQIAIMHVLSSALVPLLCDAPHYVSGTLNFITFGTIPLFAFALSCKKKKESERASLSRSDVIRKRRREEKEFSFQQRKMFQVKLLLCCCCAFNT